MTDLDRNEGAATIAEAKRPPLLPYLLLAILGFLLGLAAMAWALASWDAAARYVGVAPQPPAADRPATQAADVQQPAQTALAVPGDPELQRRVNELEQRVAEINVQARAAVGNSGRAEGLLIAFAARRALDRGVPLGYLEGLLRQRFGSTQPQAVGTVIAAAREPVTLEELRDGLREVAPQLTGAAPGQSWWDALKMQFGELITIRRTGTPSTVPAERLRRAQQRLESGQVDVALAEVLRLPGRDKARDWIDEARRYVEARRALDSIETAGLLDPPTPAPLPQPAAEPQPAEPAPASDAPPAD